MSRFHWINPSLVVATLVLGGCHGGGGGDQQNPPPPAPTTFTVGGSVTGLNGNVLLRLNGANDLTVSASGTFTFGGAALATGAGYAVGVASNPPGQVCAVTAG